MRSSPAASRWAARRVPRAKVFGDTINGLGGSAVPMAFGEVITAAKQGVIDGGDLPIVNMKALKIYDVSKYASMTYHNYGPTNAVMNLEVWNGLTPDQQKLIMDLSRAAQEKIREATESVDNFAKASRLELATGRSQIFGPQVVGSTAPSIAGIPSRMLRLLSAVPKFTVTAL